MKKSNNIHKFFYVFFGTLIVAFILVSAWYLNKQNIAVLNPKGPIALKEFHLIVFSLLLSLLVVLPVFTLLIVFAWKYREGNTKSKYSPELDHNKILETIWWVIPSFLIIILGIVAWNSSHELDPFKPLDSSIKPITIQVVALNWKWLFIYPKQNIATVNYFLIPNKTPVNFEVTSDAPMNSFWIPQLGGQIYAMPGMSTQLHLSADGDGSYRGLSANISGNGFAGMTFTARSTSTSDFNIWLQNVKNSPKQLSLDEYNKLSQPSSNNPSAYYSSTQSDLYNNIVYKYLAPNSASANSDGGGRTQILPNIQKLESEGMQGMSM